MKRCKEVNPWTPRPKGRGLFRVDPEPHFFTPSSKAGFGGVEWVDKSWPLCFLNNHLYIGGLRTFGALGDFEFNFITLSQGKSFTLNSSTMNEYILRTFHFNKPKALLIAEPLDSTLRHYNLPSKSDLQVAIPCRILQKTAEPEIPF